MAIDRTVNNVMVSRVVNMLNIEITPIIDDYKMSSIGPIKLTFISKCSLTSSDYV